jgi:hypothetical protein
MLELCTKKTPIATLGGLVWLACLIGIRVDEPVATRAILLLLQALLQMDLMQSKKGSSARKFVGYVWVVFKKLSEVGMNNGRDAGLVAGPLFSNFPTR